MIAGDLFSLPYLNHHLPTWPEWQEEDGEIFSSLRSLYIRQQSHLPEFTPKQLRQSWLVPILQLLGISCFESSAPDAACPTLPIIQLAPWTTPLGYGVSTSQGWQNSAFQLIRRLQPLREGENAPTWGILTNGQEWRLYYRKARSIATEFYSVNLLVCLQSRQTFPYFWLFFRAAAFGLEGQGYNFLERLQQTCAAWRQQRVQQLEQSLIQQTLPALAEQILQEQGQGSDRSTGLPDVYTRSLTHLFTALFARLAGPTYGDARFGSHDLPNSLEPELLAGLRPQDLGRLYESLLAYHLVQDSIAPLPLRLEHQREQRRNTGTFYTPEFMIQYVIRYTLEPLVANQKPTAIVPDLQICDPAMGSGHFLLAVVDFLTDRWIAQLNEQTYTSLRQFLSRQGFPAVEDAILLKCWIGCHCIYGIDLNPLAVAIARLSLGWHLGLVDGWKQDDRRLIQGDFLSQPSREFPQKFDAIVGNPPYIKSGRLKQIDPDRWANYTQTLQLASRGEFDLYLCFVERSLQYLQPGGRCGLILPNKWLTSRVGEGLRNLLQQQQWIEFLVDFKALQLFRGIKTYTCLLFLQQGRRGNSQMAVLVDAQGATQPLPGETGLWQTHAMASSAVGFFPATPSGDPLENFPPLATIAHIFKGTGTSADGVFMLEQVGTQLYSHSLQQWVELETDLLRPALVGKGIKPYFYQTRHQLLFPYKRQGETIGLMAPTAIAACYPKVWAYLNHPVNRAKLQQRDRDRYHDRSDWYGYGRPQNLLQMEQPKLVCPDVAGQARFSFDQANHYIVDNAYGVCLRSGVEFSLLTLMAILNSSLLTRFLHQTGTSLQGGYFRLKTAYLNPFPIPPVLFEMPSELRKKHLNQIISIYQQLITTGAMSPIAFHPLLQQKEVIHDFLAYLAIEMITAREKRHLGTIEFLTWLGQAMGVDWHQLAGKTYLMAFLGDGLKRDGPLSWIEVQSVLQKNRSKLKVDLSDFGLQTQWEQAYNARLTVLLPVQQKIELLDRLIETLVYRLYGLPLESSSGMN